MKAITNARPRMAADGLELRSRAAARRCPGLDWAGARSLGRRQGGDRLRHQLDLQHGDAGLRRYRQARQADPAAAGHLCHLDLDHAERHDRVRQ